MIKKRQRNFIPTVLKLAFKANDIPHTEVPSIDLASIIAAIRENENGNAKSIDRFRSKGNVYAVTRLIDMDHDTQNHWWLLLLQHKNANFTDPAIGSLESSDIRVDEILNGEGQSIGAHVLVCTTPCAQRPNEYLALIEDVSGFTVSAVKRFLNRLFIKSSRRFRISKDMDGEKVTRTIQIRSSYEFFPGQTLGESLEEGALKGIELIRTFGDGSGTELDEPDIAKQVRQIAYLTIGEGSRNSTLALDALKGILKRARELDYTRMKLRITDSRGTNLSGADYDISDIDHESIDNEDIAAWGLVKRYRELFNIDLEQSPEGIVNDIKGRMVLLLSQEQSRLNGE